MESLFFLVQKMGILDMMPSMELSRSGRYSCKITWKEVNGSYFGGFVTPGGGTTVTVGTS